VALWAAFMRTDAARPAPPRRRDALWQRRPSTRAVRLEARVPSYDGTPAVVVSMTSAKIVKYERGLGY
jgi:hypothetical protein